MTLLDSLGKYSHRKRQKAFFYEMKSLLFSMIDQIDSAKLYQLKASELDTSSYWYNVCYILANADGYFFFKSSDAEKDCPVRPLVDLDEKALKIQKLCK